MLMRQKVSSKYIIQSELDKTELTNINYVFVFMILHIIALE